MCVDFSVASFLILLTYFHSCTDGVKNEVLVEYKHPCRPVLCTEENVNMHITYSVTLEICTKRKISLSKDGRQAPT